MARNPAALRQIAIRSGVAKEEGTEGMPIVLGRWPFWGSLKAFVHIGVGDGGVGTFSEFVSTVVRSIEEGVVQVQFYW
jgi:hypothetical protein